MRIVSKLAIKNMKANKKRTMVSIIAITLSCMMIFMICFFFSTYRENQKKNIINNIGDYHVLISNIKYKDINNFNNKDIDKYYVYKTDDIEYRSKIIVNTLIRTNTDYLKSLNITSGRLPNNDKELMMTEKYCKLNDEFISNDTNYKIVGCFKNNSNYLYTLSDIKENDNISILLYFKDIKDIRVKTNKLLSNLPESTINYNSQLLSYYGNPVDQSGVLNNALYNVIVLLTCTLVGVFILLVVYNTYSISIIERKKSFAVLSSVGATKTQVIKTLMIEAIIELLIGIIIGFIISYSIFNITIHIINTTFYKDLIFIIHLPYLLICMTILLIFVLLSSIMPSIEASYINSISVIRGNKDIKNKKIKKSIFDFNIESAIAHRNIKRNKRKYGVTTFSIVLSFVLFVTFSIFFNLLNINNTDIVLPNYDYQIIYEDNNIDEFLNKLIIDSVEKSNVFRLKHIYTDISKDNYLEGVSTHNGFTAYNLYDSYEKEYLNKIGLNLEIPIFINYTVQQNYETNEIYKGKVFEENHKGFNICNRNFNANTNKPDLFDCINIDNINYTTTIPFGIYIGLDSGNMHRLIVNDELFNKLPQSYEYDNNYYIYLNVKDIIEFDEHINSLKEEFQFDVINQKRDNLESMYSLVVTFIVLFMSLTFIILFSIINIYNSISTNINSRKREFAVLRSIGMNNKSFNKMIILESIYFSLKSIVLGILISLSIYFVLRNIYSHLFSLQQMINKDAIFNFPLPLKYIIIASFVLIVTVYMCMKSSLKKENNGNIIDVIKEDVY